MVRSVAGNLPEQVKNNQSVNTAAGNGGQKMSQYSWFTVYFIEIICRGQIVIMILDKTECSGCGACYSSCPLKCITMMTDEEGFQYPSIDNEKCTQCGLCKQKCPILNGKTAFNSINLSAYAAFNCDESIRRKSSSGGNVFYSCKMGNS